MRTDEELFLASLSQPDLFTEVVRRLEGPFLNKAKRLTGSADDAADLVQDAFVKIYIQGRRFEPRGEGSFRAWAHTVLIRTCLSYLRRVKKERLMTVHLDNDLAEQLADTNSFSFNHYAVTDAVLLALSRVPVAMKKILSLHFLNGLTTSQIAELEGISEGAARTRLSRAKKEFKYEYELSNE